MASLTLLLSLGCGAGTIALGDSGVPDTDAETDTDTDTDADTGTDTDTDTDTVDPDAPVCTILSPADGFAQAFDVEFTFAASATDPQDGALSGAAITWTTSADAAPLGTGTTLLRTLPASGVQSITCTATDADGNTGATSIAVTAISPTVEIWHPSDGETREAGVDIPWIGRGTDMEEGALTSDDLLWSSSIDGPFGVGESFNAPLSPGVHVITLTATDAQGNVSAATLSLTVE